MRLWCFFLLLLLCWISNVQGATVLTCETQGNSGIYQYMQIARVNITFNGTVGFAGLLPYTSYCNAAFRVSVNGTRRPMLVDTCTYSGAVLTLWLHQFGDWEPQSGMILKVEHLPNYSLMSTNMTVASATLATFTCLTADRVSPVLNRLAISNRFFFQTTFAAIFSEPVFLCQGAPSFTAPANLTTNFAIGVLSGTMVSQLSGLVWTLDLAYGSYTTNVDQGWLQTGTKLCDAAGNVVFNTGLAWIIVPFTLGQEPRVFARQVDQLVFYPKIYDYDLDGIGDSVAVSTSVPVLTPPTTFLFTNHLGQTDYLTGCETTGNSQSLFTCQAPTLSSFGFNMTLQSTNNASLYSAFVPYAQISVGASFPVISQVRPIVTSVTAAVGDTSILVTYNMPCQSEVIAYSMFFFIDPSGLLSYGGETDHKTVSVRILLNGGPLDVPRFSIQPFYVAMNPQYVSGFPLAPQWYPVALSFTTVATYPVRLVVSAGLRLDISFYNYTDVSVTLDHLYLSGLNMTCPISGPLLYNSSEIRFNVSSCAGITSGLKINATKGAIDLGSARHLERLFNYPVEYQSFYPIYPEQVYLYDRRTLAIWYNPAFVINLTTLNTSAVVTSCGTLSGFDRPYHYILRANFSGSACDLDALRVTVYALAFRVDAISAAGYAPAKTPTVLGTINDVVASGCLSAFNASLFYVTLGGTTGWMPMGNATLNCSSYIASILLKDGRNMYCSIDVQHEDEACVLSWRAYDTATFTNETIRANVTTCSYRGPYVETAHLHGNSTLSVQMATRSAIAADSIQDYKFSLTCNGGSATLATEPKVLVQGTVVQFDVEDCVAPISKFRTQAENTLTLSVQSMALETVHYELNLDPDTGVLTSQSEDMFFSSYSCVNYLHRLDVYSAFPWSLVHVQDPAECLNATSYDAEAVFLTLKSDKYQQEGSTASCSLQVTLVGGYGHSVTLNASLYDASCTLVIKDTGLFQLDHGLSGLFIACVTFSVAGFFLLVGRRLARWQLRREAEAKTTKKPSRN